MLTRLRHPRRRGQILDAGFSLPELLVAMGIFSVLLVAFGSAVQLMATTTSKVKGISDAATQARAVVDLLSRQLPYASAVNLPTTPAGGRDVYFEFQTDAVQPGSPAVCTQWRQAADVGELQVRSWDVVGLNVTPWRTVATGLSNDPATQAVFTVSDDAGQPRVFLVPRVAVDLHLKVGSSPDVETRAVFAVKNARNTPVASNGVCQQKGRP